jgi:hypothetical protein
MPGRLLPQNTWMARSPLPSGLPPSLSGMGSGLAYFVDQDGNRIDTIECGQPFDFRVEGFSQVYLRQTKDGQLQYDGMLNVPMGYYTSSCFSDPGLYHGEVYDPYVGVLLATYDFTVTGSPVSVIPGGSTGLMIGAAAILLLWMGRRRKAA